MNYKTIIENKYDPLNIKLLQQAHEEFVSEFRLHNSNDTSINNFLKGANWSPDGKLILSSSEDGRLRLYLMNIDFQKINNSKESSYITPPKDLLPWLQTDEGETIYDFCWYPLMNLDDPPSCFYASISRDHPIHLFNPVTYSFLSYISLDEAESLISTYSVGIHPNGDFLFGGSNNKIFSYDITRPGPPLATHYLSTRRSKGTQKGIISSFAFHFSDKLIACGSYNRSIYLYDPTCKMAFVSQLFDHSAIWGGVTSLKWYDENHLASSHRSDQFIRFWDIRNCSEPLFRFARNNSTPQRLTFDFSHNFLFCGDDKGDLLVYNVKSLSFFFKKQLHFSPVVSTHIHPTNSFILTASGTKSFKEFDQLNSSDSDTNQQELVLPTIESSFLDNYIKIWSFNNPNNHIIDTLNNNI